MIISKKFDNFKFASSQFQECFFEECSLKGCNFKDINFASTQFNRCNLSKADFRGAYGYNIDINSNILKKAKFSFPEVTSLLSSLDIIID